MKNQLLLFLAILLSLTFSSCNNDDEVEKSLSTQTNEWIFSIMDEVYFWTDEIPDGVSTNQDPSNYFYSLLFSGDRFSAIVPDYQELINSLNGISLEAGYEFRPVNNEGEEEVFALITYVKPNSPAGDANLKRGDLVSKVNGTTLTLSNYQSKLNEIFSNHSITYRRYNETENAFIEQPPVDLAVVQFSENPIFLDSVYTMDTQKIGYLVYNFFSNGSATDMYDNQLRQVFGKFNTENITDLVIDLRYNSGGSINSATNLASLIAPNVSSNDVFYRNQWNNLYQNYWPSQPDGEAQLRGYFNSEPDNIGNKISGNVYILTGTNTASASELLINGLDPYMNVTIIGRTTVGKNVGSIPFEDEDNPDNNYGILPIVIRLANADGYAGYENGFTPLGENKIREFDFRLISLGDIEEPLLARSIELITGTATGGRKKFRTSGKNVRSLGSSIERHLRSNKAVLKNRFER